MTHRVCVFTCPVCSSEKVVSDFEKNSLSHITCKKCFHKSEVKYNQQCFEFRGVTATNYA